MKTEPHLLRYLPQLLITVASMWIQVHPESAGQNKDFLFKTEQLKSHSSRARLESTLDNNNLDQLRLHRLELCGLS